MNDPKELTAEEAEQMEARNRLKQRFGSNAQIGGKGSVRRKKQPTGNKAKKNEDKRILAVIKRFQPQPLADVLELNMFRDDNTVLHFKRPQVQFAMRDSFMYLNGEGESKDLKDLLPDILQQVGAQQYEYLKKYATNMHQHEHGHDHQHDHSDHQHKDDDLKGDKQEVDDEIPELVETNFEEVSKKE